MTFDHFEIAAREAFDAIPEQYLAGVDGLSIQRKALPHPERAGIYTLGECVTEAYPSGYDSAETVRSQVVLYYGSFRALSRQYPGFDWEAELWETLTHELQHHLESLAGRDGLEGVDAAMEQHFARLEGEHFDSHYYRWGESLGEGRYRVEDLLFIERDWRGETPAEIRFEHRGQRCVVGVPARLGDVHFLVLEEIPEYWGEVEVVLIRRRSWRERLGALFGGRRPLVLESFAPVRIEGRGGPWNSTTAI